MAPKPSRATVHVIDDDASLCAALESVVESVGLLPRLYDTANEVLSADNPDTLSCVIVDPTGAGLTFDTPEMRKTAPIKTRRSKAVAEAVFESFAAAASGSSSASGGRKPDRHYQVSLNDTPSDQSKL